MITRAAFATGEIYHCYTRGVEGRTTYQDENDYARFTELLYLCNSEKGVHRSNLTLDQRKNVFLLDRSAPLVSILAYAVMPNHFHILLKEVRPGGISKFMLKLGTAYSMYFNKKYERIGGLFITPFRSKHIDDDQYLQHVANYIHLNPAELHESQWKEGRVSDLTLLKNYLLNYRYSSLCDHQGISRNESALLDVMLIKELFSTSKFSAMLKEAAQYYKDHSPPIIKGSP